MYDWLFDFDFAPRHTDTHYAMVEWDESKFKFDPKNNLSYTIPIKLPKNGAGVYFWDEYFYVDMTTNYQENATRMFSKELDKKDAHYHEHQLGLMITHSGNQYHQVGAFNDIEDEDCRITIQGHAIKNDIDDTYYAFW